MDTDLEVVRRKTTDRKGAAEYFGVCVMTVDRAIRDGELEYYRIGRRVVFDIERHLDAFLLKNERKMS